MINFFQKKTLADLVREQDHKGLSKYIDRQGVEAVDDQGCTALVYAVRYQWRDMIVQLLEWGADVQSLGMPDEELFVTLLACVDGELLALFAQAGMAIPETIHYEDPLHFCVGTGVRDSAVYQLLLDHDCDINVLDSRGLTPLAVILGERQPDKKLAAFFLCHGADPLYGEARQKSAYFTLIDNRFVSALEKARLFELMLPVLGGLTPDDVSLTLKQVVEQQNVPMFLALIPLLGQVDICTEPQLEDFLTPKYFTPQNQQKLVAASIGAGLNLPISREILRAQGQDLPVETGTARGLFRSLMDIDCSLAEKRTLLEQHADGEDLSAAQPWQDYQLNALQALVLEHWGHAHICDHVKLLLEYGIPCETSEQSALLFAARFMHLELLELLLKQGADALFIDQDDESLLSEMTRFGLRSKQNKGAHSYIQVLELLQSLLGAEQLELLLQRPFMLIRNPVAGQERYFLPIYGFAMTLAPQQRQRLMAFLLQPAFCSNPGLEMSSPAFAEEVYKPLLAHIVSAKDEPVISRFFANYPAYRISSGHEMLLLALEKGLSSATILTLLKRSDALADAVTVAFAHLPFSTLHGNALFLLGAHAASCEHLDVAGILPLAEYLVTSGGDINSIGSFGLIEGEETGVSCESCFLLECLLTGNEQLVSWALDQGADPLQVLGAAGDTLPLLVLDRGSRNLTAIFALLLERGVCQLEGKDSAGRTLLHAAAARCHSEVISWLLQRGAAANAPYGGGDVTPLLSALSTHLDIPISRRQTSVSALLAGGAAVDGVNGMGTTPLMIAAGYGALAIVKDLLAQGADVGLRDQDGRNAVNYALQGAVDMQSRRLNRMNEGIKRQILMALTQAGCDLNCCPGEEAPALIEALRGNYRLLFRTLVEQGADVNVRDHQGIPALVYALTYGRTSELTALLKHPAIDVQALSSRGDNLWHFLPLATKDNDFNFALQTLCDAAVPMVVNADGEHPLHMAVLHGRVGLAETILAMDPCVNVADHQGHTPLMCVAMAADQRVGNQARLALANLLLDQGADIDARNDKGSSALKLAQNLEQEALAALLLQRGADPDSGRRRIGF